MTTLYINLHNSRCGACGRNADPNEPAHYMGTMDGDGCQAYYTHVSSDYSGVPGLSERIRQMRPDLVATGLTS